MSVLALNYGAHERFVEPARASAQLWRLALGIVLVAGIFLVLSQMIFGTLFRVMGPETAAQIARDGQSGQTAAGMFLLLAQLGLLAVASGIVCVIVHKRGALTLIGPLHLALRQFLAVSFGLIVLSIVLFLLPPYGFDAPLERNMTTGRWLLLLPFGLVAVLVQSGAEEVFFRGYVQQQLAARFRSPLIWLVLPAALFGLGHYLPDSAGGNATTIAVWAMIFGLLTADLTARAGTLGPAIALHFFNNVSAMLVISVPDEMSGLALFVLPFGIADEAHMAAWLPVDFGLMIVGWLTARLALRA